MNNLIRISTAAHLLNVSVTAVNYYIRAGYLQLYRVDRIKMVRLLEVRELAVGKMVTKGSRYDTAVEFFNHCYEAGLSPVEEFENRYSNLRSLPNFNRELLDRTMRQLWEGK